jgi:hypothetical protein
MGWGASALALMASAVIVAMLFRRPEPDLILLVRRPFSAPASLRDRVERWIPQNRRFGWAHRALDIFLGRRIPVNLDIEAFAFPGAFSTSPIELGLGRPSGLIRRDGLTLWLLSSDEVNTLRVRLENNPARVCYRSRVSTADGIGAGLFMGSSLVLEGGTNQIGIQEEFLPLTGRRGLDLFASLRVSQVISNDPSHFDPTRAAVFVRTNADFAVRLQLPYGRAAFVLKRDPLVEDGTSSGLVLEPR